MAIAPGSGNIYMAWRRFAHSTDGDAIMTSYSTDGGKTFCKAIRWRPSSPVRSGDLGHVLPDQLLPGLDRGRVRDGLSCLGARGVGPGATPGSWFRLQRTARCGLRLRL